MAKNAKWVLLGLIFMIFLFPQSGYCRNIQTRLGLFDVHGFITQETSWGIGSTQDFHNVSDQLHMQLEAGFTPSGTLGNYVSFYGIFRFRSDWAYAINRGSGWWDSGADGMKGSYSFHKRAQLQEYSWAYGRNRDLDLPREIYADINIGNWSFRLGKQQVVWGESDGIRLMDCINPQDLQFQFYYYDSDEGYERSRIPLWLIKARYYFPHEWFGGLIRDQSIEFVINPGDNEVDRFNVAGGWRGVPYKRQKYITTYGDYDNEAGPWALPNPWLPQFAQVSTHDHKPRGHAEFAVRWIMDLHSWHITVNGFYGYQRFFILKWKGVNFRPDAARGGLSPAELAGIGTLAGNPATAPMVAGLAGDIANGHYKITTGWHGYGSYLMNPHLMQFNYNWIYPRKKLVGFTVDKSMDWFRWRNTSPVLRIEAQYEFSKPFNTNGRTNGWRVNPKTGRFEGLEWTGFADYLNAKWYGDDAFANYHGIVHRDVLRYMIGYDWPIWIYWLNDFQNFFTSFQFFHFRVMNYGGQKLVRSPFVFNRGVVNVTLNDFANNPNILNKYVDPWTIPRDRFYVTYLVQGKYDHQRIIPQLLYVHDLTNDVFWIKAKVMFKYGDIWREELGWLGIFADSDADYHGTGKSFGLTSHSDQVWFKITRLFN